MSQWTESHARQVMAAHMCKIVPTTVATMYSPHGDPGQERMFRESDSVTRQYWLTRADEVLRAVLDSEDSLRMAVIHMLLVSGEMGVVLRDGGFFLQRQLQGAEDGALTDFERVSSEQGWSEQTETLVLRDFVSEYGLGAALAEYAASRAESEQLGVEEEDEEDEEEIVPWEPECGVD